jgi:hypothetical protein
MRLLIRLYLIISPLCCFGQNTINNHIQRVDTLIANKGTFYITKVEKLYIVGEASIPAIDNFTATLDSNTIVAKPLQGNWGNPFYAYPVSDSLTDGIIFDPGWLTIETNKRFLLVDGKPQFELNFMSSTTKGPATPQFGYVFRFKNFPRLLMFGDMNDSNTWHIIALKR